VGLVLTASLDGTISLFSHRLKVQQRLYSRQQKEAKKAGGIHSLCYSAKNRWVANTNGRSIYLWDINSEETVHIISGQPARVLQLTVDNRNDLLVGLLSNSLVHCWSTNNLDLRQVVDARGQENAYNRSDRDGSEFVNSMVLFENKELMPVQMAHKNPTKQAKKKIARSSKDDAKARKIVTGIQGGNKGAKMDIVGVGDDDDEDNNGDDGNEEKDGALVQSIQHFPFSMCLAGQLLKCWKLAPESITGLYLRSTCALRKSFTYV